MVITKELIEEWRKERDNGMVSAIGEYTPDEFWAALDEIERPTAEIARLTEERDAYRASSDIRGANVEAMRNALVEIRDRIKEHPAYADLTEAEEMDVGGDTAELSYLARVADAAIGA